MPAARFRLDGPLDLFRTLWPVRRGLHDPTTRFAADGVWRATRTADGPATMRLRVRGGWLEAETWGPGAELALAAAPELAGLADRPDDLEPRDALVRDVKRRLPGLRLPRAGAVLETLVPSIIDQKVTGLEARRAYAGIVRSFGERAPGPAALMLPPRAEHLAALPYFAFHRFGIERRRADTIRRACALADRIEAAGRTGTAELRRRLLSIEGIGEWTAAEVTRLALGDPDAVSVGDYHVPSLVTWSFAGEPRGNDARMLELLEPYRGQRARVVRLLEVGGSWSPRRGPRMPPREIAAI